MGWTKVSRGDREVADELHATRIADDVISPGGLVGVVGQTCVRSTGLSPSVCNRSHIDPSPLTDKMGERGKISNITIEIPNEKGGAFRSEQRVFMTSMDELIRLTCCPW